MKEIKGQVLDLIRAKREVIRSGISSAQCRTHDEYLAACRMVRDYDLLLADITNMKEEDE